MKLFLISLLILLSIADNMLTEKLLATKGFMEANLLYALALNLPGGLYIVKTIVLGIIICNINRISISVLVLVSIGMTMVVANNLFLLIWY